MHVDTSVVLIDAIAYLVAADVAVERHLEVSIYLHQLIPHIRAVVALDSRILVRRDIPALIRRPNKRMGQHYCRVVGVLSLPGNRIGPIEDCLPGIVFEDENQHLAAVGSRELVICVFQVVGLKSSL